VGSRHVASSDEHFFRGRSLVTFTYCGRLAHAGDTFVLGAERASYYTTAPLQKTLEELVDFHLVYRCRPRLTIGAAHARTSQIYCFDSRAGVITVKHVMASGALPPMRIDSELYWDGGILSNKPTEAVFDDTPRKDSLIFRCICGIRLAPSQQRWRKSSTAKRTCNLPAGSQVRSCASNRFIGCGTSSISLLKESPSERIALRRCFRAMVAGPGCMSCVSSPCKETHTKDIDFTPNGIKERWDAGYAHTKSVLSRMPWVGEFDPLSDVVFHEHMELIPQAAEEILPTVDRNCARTRCCWRR
jgi:NTE family protein